MSSGEETQRAHVNTHVNHSTVPPRQAGEERDENEKEKEGEKERGAEPRINGQVGKRGTGRSGQGQ